MDVARSCVNCWLEADATTTYVQFSDGNKAARNYWLTVDETAVDLCIDDPGHELDLQVMTDVRTLTRVLMGDLSLSSARSTGLIRLVGDSALIRSMGAWLEKSHFADVSRPRPRGLAPARRPPPAMQHQLNADGRKPGTRQASAVAVHRQDDDLRNLHVARLVDREHDAAGDIDVNIPYASGRGSERTLRGAAVRLLAPIATTGRKS